jgi:hypothetical protein
MRESQRNFTEQENSRHKSNFSSITNKLSARKNEKDKKVDNLYHVRCFALQASLPTATEGISNFVIKSNTLHKIVLSVTFRWKD